MADSYHHGTLRAELLTRAVEVIGRDGPSELSLRSLAREAGVSHAAPAHHFSSRTGLLTAVAADGFTLLAGRLTDASARGFLELGVAYVGFARDHPAHFEVMFRADLIDADDPVLHAARASAWAVLRQGVEAMSAAGAVSDAAAAVLAGWSLVHGLATLAATGNLDTSELRELIGEPDLSALTRRTGSMLFGSPGVTR